MTSDNAPPDTPEKRHVPWRGRKRTDNPREKVLTLRLTAHDHTKVLHRAEAAGLSLSAYARRLISGTAGVPTFKVPSVDKVELGRLLGLAGNIASNNNQMAHYCHLRRATPELAKLTSQQHLLNELVSAAKRALSRGYLTILVQRLDRMTASLDRMSERLTSPEALNQIRQIRQDVADMRSTLTYEIRHTP